VPWRTGGGGVDWPRSPWRGCGRVRSATQTKRPRGKPAYLSVSGNSVVGHYAGRYPGYRVIGSADGTRDQPPTHVATFCGVQTSRPV
jgi:hypothetical protein